MKMITVASCKHPFSQVKRLAGFEWPEWFWSRQFNRTERTRRDGGRLREGVLQRKDQGYAKIDHTTNKGGYF